MFWLEDEISAGLNIGVLHHTMLGHMLNSGGTSIASGEGSPLATSLTPSPEQMDSRDMRSVERVVEEQDDARCQQLYQFGAHAGGSQLVV